MRRVLRFLWLVTKPGRDMLLALVLIPVAIVGMPIVYLAEHIWQAWKDAAE